MIIPSIRGKDLQAKQEEEINSSKLSKGATSSRQFQSGFRNPRIVRVSRTFGGKDRHSKVSTIRGLRDRRIRLSVSTAVQLYDLQDRLGLNQPSKVIDWLLDATKHDIDELPPLQIPPGGFNLSHQFPVTLGDHELHASQSSLIAPFADANMSSSKDGGTNIMFSSKAGFGVINNDVNMEDQIAMSKSRHSWDPLAAGWRTKGEEIKGDAAAAANKIQTQSGVGVYGSNPPPQVHSAQNLFPMAINHASFPGFPNSVMPYTPFYHWEPSSLSFPQLGNITLPSQADQDPQNNNSSTMLFQPSLPIPSGSQLLFCPPAASSHFPTCPPQTTSASHADNEPRSHFNQFQVMGSASQNTAPSSLLPLPQHSVSSPLKSFPLNMNAKLLHLQTVNDHSLQPRKDNATGR